MIHTSQGKASVVADAEDRRRGLTIDELAVFVQQALRVGIPGDSRVEAVVGMFGQIKQAKVTGEAP